MPEKTFEEKLQRVEDFQQIQNIMGRYPYYIMAGKATEYMTKMFAKKAPDIRVYLGEQGYREGPDAPYRGMPNPLGPDAKPQTARVGSLIIHAPICPVIEVAGDGQTAKGVWIGLGLIGEKRRETGEPEGIWEWDKYGVDFIKEDNEWKIWRHHIYRLLHQWGVDEKWPEQFDKPDEGTMMPRPSAGGPGGPRSSGPGSGPPKFDGPAVDDNPYRPDTVQRLVPKPPEPYETWTDTFMY